MRRSFLDYVEIVGKTPEQFNGTKKYVSTGAVDFNVIDEEQVEYVDYENKPSRANLETENGDVLFAKMQNTKKILKIDCEKQNYIFSTGFFAVRPRKNMITNNCLYHLLCSEYFLEQKDKNCSGATQKAITNIGLSKINIKIPDLEYQDNITMQLDKIDSIMHSRKQQLSKLDELVKARFVEMFGDPVLNPYNWDVVVIGDIVTDVRYGTSKPAVEGGKYPYLRMNNLTYDGYLDLSDMKYIDIPDNEIDKCIVRKGDVLFNRTNSIELVGKTCVFDMDDDMVIAGYIIRVRLNEKLLPIMLSNYMNLPSLKKQIRSMAKGAVNQANINAQELQNIKIYLPPMELQKQFADFVEQNEKSKSEIQKSLEKLEMLKKALMQKYFW